MVYKISVNLGLESVCFGVSVDKGEKAAGYYVKASLLTLKNRFERTSCSFSGSGISGETRYVYDGAGRMTEWYDAEGVRQVRNTYDTKGCVIRQLDANGGEYALEYHRLKAIDR